MIKIAVISTSPRKGSNSLKAARYIRSVLAANGYEEVALVDFEEADIPLIGRGEPDPEKPTAFQKRLLSAWSEADLVIFTVPEYNWITGGELINALHQLGSKGFSYLFDDKVFALTGVSDGRGGRRPCLEIGILLNKLISFLNKKSIVSPKIFESHETDKNLDENGAPKGNVIYEKGVADFVSYTLSIVKRWHGQ